MTQREDIKALRDEVAELRKQMSALSVAMVELAAHQPVKYVPYYVQPYVQPTWPQPWITWTSHPNSDGQTVTASGSALDTSGWTCP